MLLTQVAGWSDEAGQPNSVVSEWFICCSLTTRHWQVCLLSCLYLCWAIWEKGRSHHIAPTIENAHCHNPQWWFSIQDLA